MSKYGGRTPLIVVPISMTTRNLGKKGFIWFDNSCLMASLYTVIAATPVRNLEARTEAEATEKHYLLPCSS